MVAAVEQDDPALAPIFDAAASDGGYQDAVVALEGAKRCKNLPPDQYARQLCNVWDSLSTKERRDGSCKLLILDGSRIVVPPGAKEGILKELHRAHCGMTKTKKQAAQLYYWPGMNKDIERLIQSCRFCLALLPSQPAEPLQLSHADEPLERLSADLCFVGGKNWLIAADFYSGFPFVFQLKETSSRAVINHLENIFCLFGAPKRIRTDGGPQFRAEFSAFCARWNINHELSSAYNPTSNGHAESAVKNMKHLLAKCLDAGESFLPALLHWRSTPRADGFSPSELFLGRRPRTLLPRISLTHRDHLDPDPAAAARANTREGEKARRRARRDARARAPAPSRRRARPRPRCAK